MKAHRTKQVDLRRVAVSLGVSAAILLVGVHGSGATPADLARRLLWPMLQLMGTIGVGLVVGLRDTNKIDVGFPDGLKTLAHGASL